MNSLCTDAFVKMNDQISLSNVNSLLLQLALQTRELSQRKNELKQQIKVCRADIAEKKTYIESIHRKIKKLEEEIRVKRSIVTHNKANAKSMRMTNSLLLQYEQTLKAELESRKSSYTHDMEDYEERITSYRQIFQSHKEHYYQNPLAQKLLMLQAEKEAIGCRIRGYDEQITIKLKKLDCLADPAANSSSTDELPDKISGQQLLTEPEKKLDPQIDEQNDSSIGTSSLCLNQSKNDHEASVEVNVGDLHEENEVEDTSHYQGEARNELCSYKQLDETRWPHKNHVNDQDKESQMQDQVMEQQTTALEVEDPVEDNVEDGVSVDEDQAQHSDYSDTLTVFPQSSSQEDNQSSFPAKMTAASSTRTFLFNFSPTSSPRQGTSDKKSPVFPFSMNTDPSTPAFSGFGFGTSRDEDSSFTFPSSFFNKKKTAESKSLSCSGFLFDHSEQSDDFQFSFTTNSPPPTKKHTSEDEFPFSFNF